MPATYGGEFSVPLVITYGSFLYKDMHSFLQVESYAFILF